MGTDHGQDVHCRLAWLTLNDIQRLVRGQQLLLCIQRSKSSCFWRLIMKPSGCFSRHVGTSSYKNNDRTEPTRGVVYSIVAIGASGPQEELCKVKPELLLLL